MQRPPGRRPPSGRRARPGGLAALWRRPEHEILDLLAAARAAYLAQVKEHNHDNERMIVLNLAWRRVCRIFRRRGYELDAPPRRD